MKIKIGDYLLPLNQAEVRLAKKHFGKLLKKVKEISEEAGRPSYYYTFLVISYVMSQDILDICDGEMLEMLLKASQNKS